jgi:hypothetical protein
MTRNNISVAIGLVLVASSGSVIGQTETGLKPASSEGKVRALEELANDEHPAIGRVQVHGDNPSLIYLPIIHDDPLNKVASTDMGGVKGVLENCKKITDHLYENYGVRSILLEGVSKEVADHYNGPGDRWQKVTWGSDATITYDTWGRILRARRWFLVPAFDKKPLGPLTLLGREYSARIDGSLKAAKEQGWFKTREIFVRNQSEFVDSINQACEGYGEKLAKILEEDPGLKKEYEITVTRRNQNFLDNMGDARKPGVVLCGRGHFHDLVAQLDHRGRLLCSGSAGWHGLASDNQG